jgi:DNA-binding winged helix-turn-helix (wHTH) protein
VTPPIGFESLRNVETPMPFLSGSSRSDRSGAIDSIWTLCEDFVERPERYNSRVAMAGCIKFAKFELDFEAYALRGPAGPLRLEKLPMEVLILLVRRAGTLVQRSEIQAMLWAPDVYVERDSAINTAIRKIRRTLGDDAENPRFVETVVGKGYRFVAPVESGAGPPAQPSVNHGRSVPWQRVFPSYSVTRGKQEFILETGETVFGRDPTVGVYVDHPSVSRRHACLSIGVQGAVLEDLKSRNGTFVNGRRIDGPTKIDHGALIGLGPIMLSFIVMAAPASTQPIGSRHAAE